MYSLVKDSNFVSPYTRSHVNPPEWCDDGCRWVWHPLPPQTLPYQTYTTTIAETEVQYTVSNILLADYKARRMAEIDRLRQKRNMGTFSHAGKEFAFDQHAFKDVMVIAGYIGMTNELPTSFPGAWKAIDNSLLLMPTVNDFKNFYASMVNTGINSFLFCEGLRADLNNATTYEEIYALVIPTS